MLQKKVSKVEFYLDFFPKQISTTLRLLFQSNVLFNNHQRIIRNAKQMHTNCCSDINENYAWRNRLCLANVGFPLRYARYLVDDIMVTLNTWPAKTSSPSYTNEYYKGFFIVLFGGCHN